MQLIASWQHYANVRSCSSYSGHQILSPTRCWSGWEILMLEWMGLRDGAGTLFCALFGDWLLPHQQRSRVSQRFQHWGLTALMWIRYFLAASVLLWHHTWMQDYSYFVLGNLPCSLSTAEYISRRASADRLRETAAAEEVGVFIGGN